MVCDRVSGMSANARTGVRAGPLAKQDCNDAVATDEVREASRSHALDSPLPGEGREPERQVSMWVSVCCALAGGAPYSPFDQFIQRRTHMTNGILTARFAQAFLAVTATVASVFVLQFAMLVG